MLHLHQREVKTVDWGGRRVLVDRERDSACYVRGDTLFTIRAPGLAKRFIRSIPLP